MLNTDDMEKATTSISSALLLTPNGKRQLEAERTFVRAAADAGVGHLVKMSTIRALRIECRKWRLDSSRSPEL